MYVCKNCGNEHYFKTKVTIKTEVKASYDEDGSVICYEDSAPYENIDFDGPFECSECGSTEVEGVTRLESGDTAMSTQPDGQCVIVRVDEGFVRGSWLVTGRENAIQVAKNMATNINFGPDDSLVVEIPATDLAGESERILTIDGRDFEKKGVMLY